MALSLEFVLAWMLRLWLTLLSPVPGVLLKDVSPSQPGWAAEFA